MKKLITALIILSVVIGACVVEIVYLKDVYDTVIERLEIVDDAIGASPEHVNNVETMTAMENVIEYWEGKRMGVMSFINHTQIKNIDDRFAMIARQLEVNASMDAAITVRTTMRLFEDLYYDSFPGLGNLL